MACIRQQLQSVHIVKNHCQFFQQKLYSHLVYEQLLIIMHMVHRHVIAVLSTILKIYAQTNNTETADDKRRLTVRTRRDCHHVK